MKRLPVLPSSGLKKATLIGDFAEPNQSDQTCDGAQTPGVALPEGSFESAVENLCRPRTITDPELSIQPNDDMVMFDEYWESLVPRLPVGPKIEPLARAVSLVPVKNQAGEALSAWLQKMLADK